jgi:ectoine hydroxylase-related dioxygenase (phytanoyl-CoA dioxygenase family)
VRKPEDVSIGSSDTRVNDFVNRGPDFDLHYVYGPKHQQLACGAAGSIIVYNGSVWHGHSANQTGQPRRSVQGAYIRRDAQTGINLAARMCPETLGRIGRLAKYVLAV